MKVPENIRPSLVFKKNITTSTNFEICLVFYKTVLAKDIRSGKKHKKQGKRNESHIFIHLPIHGLPGRFFVPKDIKIKTVLITLNCGNFGFVEIPQVFYKCYVEDMS